MTCMHRRVDVSLCSFHGAACLDIRTSVSMRLLGELMVATGPFVLFVSRQPSADQLSVPLTVCRARVSFRWLCREVCGC